MLIIADLIIKIFLLKEMCDFMEIAVKLNKGGKLPVRKHYNDGGADLCAIKIESVNGSIPYREDVCSIPPNGNAIVNCCISVAIPDGYIGDVRPRSGLFFEHGIFCAGTIDSGYRGEIKVCLRN